MMEMVTVMSEEVCEVFMGLWSLVNFGPGVFTSMCIVEDIASHLFHIFFHHCFPSAIHSVSMKRKRLREAALPTGLWRIK